MWVPKISRNIYVQPAILKKKHQLGHLFMWCLCAMSCSTFIRRAGNCYIIMICVILCPMLVCLRATAGQCRKRLQEWYIRPKIHVTWLDFLWIIFGFSSMIVATQFQGQCYRYMCFIFFLLCCCRP